MYCDVINKYDNGLWSKHASYAIPSGNGEQYCVDKTIAQ